MRSPKTGFRWVLGGSLVLVTVIASCRSRPLLSFDGWVIFMTPGGPAALRQIDAGLVEIDFGQVAVGVTETLPVSSASVAGAIWLGVATPLGDAGDLSLSVLSAATLPQQLEASFTPSKAGPQTAVFQMAESSMLVPEVTFELAGTGVGSSLLVQPNPIDFNQVFEGDIVSKTFTITNEATLPTSLMFSAMQGDDPSLFSISGTGQGPLAPGASQTFSASFSASGGYLSAFFDVTGLGGQPPIEVDLFGLGLIGNLTISPVEFGAVPVGSTATQSALVINMSPNTVYRLVAPAPAVTPLNSEFTLGPGHLSLPLAIAPGAGAVVPITFSPVRWGSAEATLLLSSNDPDGPVVRGILEGVGSVALSCEPPGLDFGPVPVGHSGVLTLVCTNLGHSPFEIAQRTLRTSSPVFEADLLLPDGGPAGAGGSLSLAVGETADVLVAFRPPDAGEYGAALAIPDGGPEVFGTTVPLKGTGVLAGPCQLEIIPPQLNFGEVPAGSQGLLQLELANVGNNLCVIDGVGLDPASDPAFALPVGPLGYELLGYPGEASNPAGLPTSLRLLVSYVPTQNQVLATGTIEVMASNASPAEALVPVSGSSRQSCLRIQPSLHDFGTVAFSADQLCAPTGTSFVVGNTCATPVAMTGLAINSGVDAVPQFALESSLRLPLSLPAMGSTGFQASFTPTSTGIKVGAITVTSDESQLAPYLVSLEGDAEGAVPQVDLFTMQAPSSSVDILWILDTDDDSEEESSLAQRVPSFVDAMSEAGIDFRMAVTTTDTCLADRSDQGALEPCDHCLLWGDAGGPEFVTSDTPNAGAELVRLLDIPVLKALPEFSICENINGDEHFFDSIAAALSADQLAGHNAGFLRENADLAVIVINGDAEDDGRGGGAGGPYLTSLTQVTTLLRQVKPTAKASVFYVASGEAVLGASQKIGQLVEATGGLEIDTTEPAGTWEPQFVGLFEHFQNIGFFPLTHVPLDPNDMQVTVNGVATGAWTYDPAQNAVILQPGSLPAPGSKIVISYSALGCPIRDFPR